MNSKKELGRFIATLLIVLVVFNVLAFVIQFNWTSTFWVAYGFTLGAIVLSFATSFYAFRGDLKSKFYGFPLINLAWMFLITNIILGLLFMGLSMCPVQVPVVLFVILYAVYGIGLIATDATKEYVETVEQEIKEKTLFIKTLQMDMIEILSQVNDNTVKDALNKLSDDIRFSDHMSSERLEDIEADIEYEMLELKKAVDEENNDDIIVLAEKLRKLLKQRNQKCKLLK